MIRIANLTPADRGRWGQYCDRFESKPDFGRIKSWNTKFIFVVYRCAGNWGDFGNYTGVTTDPSDLEFKP